MQRQTYTRNIENRVDASPLDALFIYSDFYDLAPADAVRKAVSRMKKSGKLKHVLKGIYAKPNFNMTIKEHIPPHPDIVARTLARKHRWHIAPIGVTALNLLGLSTQVPYVVEYVSDGPYREYQLGTTTIKFSHSANKELSGLSPISALVIQAIKALGKNKITDRDIATISKQLSYDDKNRLKDECRQVAVWIYDVIKEICKR
jgi:hypothetical protein